jgi:hypothetical protein
MEPLNQIERRLKLAKPQPPKLDAVALERIAGSLLVGSAGAKPASQTAVRLPEDRRRRPSRSWVTIASACTCGAIAGSVATMLIMMSRIGSNGDPIGPAVQNEGRLSPPTAGAEVSLAVAPPLERRGSPALRGATQVDKDAPVLAMLVDPSGSGRWRHGIESSTLRAGMHLAKDATAASDILSSATPTAVQAPPDDGSPRATKSEVVPSVSPEITREQILDDLLREMSGAVL